MVRTLYSRPHEREVMGRVKAVTNMTGQCVVPGGIIPVTAWPLSLLANNLTSTSTNLPSPTSYWDHALLYPELCIYHIKHMQCVQKALDSLLFFRRFANLTLGIQSHPNFSRQCTPLIITSLLVQYCTVYLIAFNNSCFSEADDKFLQLTVIGHSLQDSS